MFNSFLTFGHEKSHLYFTHGWLQTKNPYYLKSTTKNPIVNFEPYRFYNLINIKNKSNRIKHLLVDAWHRSPGAYFNSGTLVTHLTMKNKF